MTAGGPCTPTHRHRRAPAHIVEAGGSPFFRVEVLVHATRASARSRGSHRVAGNGWRARLCRVEPFGEAQRIEPDSRHSHVRRAS
jgi:hypothetical protein